MSAAGETFDEKAAVERQDAPGVARGRVAPVVVPAATQNMLLKSADRPLCGYVRADSKTTEHDLAQTVSDLAVLAAREGRELSTVIVEWTDDAKVAFKAAAAEIAGLGSPEPAINQASVLLVCAHAGQL
ncbi:MAG: hypothetical protein ACRCYQ_12040 [Nocardioides sp.]